MGLQILRSKLFAAVSSFRSRRGAFWSFGALITSCWIVMVILVRKKKNRRLTPNETRLMNIIKGKDGRIAQLLHQIAQMNQILIDRHKALAAKVVE
ncbi:putative transmembrane protein [Sesbania bispinosa]|nr:putative transmembrane protein [Sesbania bispinosa]